MTREVASDGTVVSERGLLIGTTIGVPPSGPIVVDSRPDGKRRLFYGDFLGRITETIDAVGATTVLAYTNSFLTSVKDANGNATQFQREPVIGAVTKVTHPDGTFRSLTYSNASLPYYVASVTDERNL